MVSAVIIILQIFARKQHQLGRYGNIVDAGFPGFGHIVEQLAVVETGPVGADAIAFQHERGGAFQDDNTP